MIEIKIDGVNTIEIVATGDRGRILAECSSLLHSAAEILHCIDDTKSKVKQLEYLSLAAQQLLPLHEMFASVSCDVKVTDGEDGNGE